MISLVRGLSICLTIIVSFCAFSVIPCDGVQSSSPAGEGVSRSTSKSSITYLSTISNLPVKVPGYPFCRLYSYGNEYHRLGLITDVETEQILEKPLRKSWIAGVAPLDQVWLPTYFGRAEALHVASQRLQAGPLVVYSQDTSFHTRASILPPPDSILDIDPGNKNVSAIRIVPSVYSEIHGLYSSRIYASASRNNNPSIWSISDEITDQILFLNSSYFITLG